MVEKNNVTYKQLPENTPSPTQAEWDLIIERSASPNKRNIYREASSALEVVFLIVLLIFLAPYVEFLK